MNSLIHTVAFNSAIEWPTLPSDKGSYAYTDRQSQSGSTCGYHDRDQRLETDKGLMLRIASALIIAQYVFSDMSFDKNVADRDRAYMNWVSKNAEEDGPCNPALSSFGERNIHEIESSVRIVEQTSGAFGKVFLRREENGKVIFYAEQTKVYIPRCCRL
jgi:hypothetical protein